MVQELTFHSGRRHFIGVSTARTTYKLGMFAIFERATEAVSSLLFVGWLLVVSRGGALAVQYWIRIFR